MAADGVNPSDRATGRSPSRVAVILASAGRPGVLADVLADVGRQSRRELAVVVAVPSPESLPAAGVPTGVVVAAHVRGLTAQRNAGLDAVPDATHAVYFDDDAVPRSDYVERAMAFFDAHPDVVALTGRVLLDGASGAEVSRGAAEAALEASWAPSRARGWRYSRTLYGCNFAVRLSVARGERFDERLPLYGWLEDHDLARRLMRHGRLASVDDCVVVHRGVKSGGRTAHRRLGYSQVMNPSYLARTGSFPLWLALWEVFRPVAKNVVRSLAHTERSWRRRRLAGNAAAALDVARGRFTPERAVELE